ncbi:MAG: glycosyltransferase family 4 protein [Phycisphaerae bacterium]|nr:glycosyltransferase family 4 protein [Phycisphaerae bacterium]
MKRIKVAMVGLRGLADGLGGVEKVVREISTRLADGGVDVTCYCRSRYNQAAQHKGVKLVNTATLYSKHAETALYALGSLVTASRGDYDIIHIHALASSTLAWIPRWFSGKKVVVTVHGLDWQRAKWGPVARAVLRAGQWSAVHFADRVTCVSMSLRDYFRGKYSGCDFEYIPNGCDTPPSLPSPVPDGLAAGGYILFMGRLTPEKAPHRLIEAFRRIETDKRLIIAGPSHHAAAYARKLRQLAGDDERIEFVGPVTGDRKEQLLRHAYLFVLPSELEGLPIALIEAAGRGICPLVSNIAPAVEVIGGSGQPCGFVCEAKSTQSLQATLQTALANPSQVASFGQEAQQYVQKHYNWNAAAAAIKDIYEQLLQKQ